METAGSAILLLNISMTHEYIVWGCGHGQNATAILLLMVAMACMGVPVTAQVPSPSIPPESPSPPVTCNFANTSTISSNWCNYNEQSSTESLTLGCKSFLTNSSVPAPSTECCQGFNSIANKSTACICMATFYPPATHNMTRQLELPRLCGLKTDLCGQCPKFLVSRSNATASPYTGECFFLIDCSSLSGGETDCEVTFRGSLLARFISLPQLTSQFTHRLSAPFYDSLRLGAFIGLVIEVFEGKFPRRTNRKAYIYGRFNI